MEQDRQKWNRIFSGRPELAPSAPEFLSRQCGALNRGSVLDLACGDGAAALFLAEAGFEVTAVDIADAGLTRLQHFARQRGLDIETNLLDLDQPAGLAGLALFDNIVISRFKPPRVCGLTWLTNWRRGVFWPSPRSTWTTTGPRVSPSDSAWHRPNWKTSTPACSSLSTNLRTRVIRPWTATCSGCETETSTLHSMIGTGRP